RSVSQVPPMNLAVAPKASAALGKRIRVMIVDDAVVVRGLFSRWVGEEPDLEVVAALRTGREAVNQVERAEPDVIVLDVDMPEMDGIAALPLLLEKIRTLGLRAKRLRLGRVASPPLQPAAKPAPVTHSGLALRPMPLTAPRVLLIGCSTGGPQALNAIVTRIDSVIERAPVLVT